MPQDVRPIIPNNTTCFDYLHDIDPSAGNEQIRGLLGRMLFRGDEGVKPTKAWSGGEAVRLLFCKLMLVQPNVLVLDEPTSHLDLESISALADGLQNYPGTVLFVAHDRDLISTTATRIFGFTHGKLEDFAGDYETFLDRHGGFVDAHRTSPFRQPVLSALSLASRRALIQVPGALWPDALPPVPAQMAPP